MIGIFQKLSSKLVAILVAFFLVALIAISSTLYVSRQFEGGAAAINDAGSQRMRSYRLAYLLTYDIHHHLDASLFEREVRNEMVIFEKTLAGLERGDPTRPLFLPKNDAVRGQMEKLHREWRGHIKPLLEGVLKSGSRAERDSLLRDYRPAKPDLDHLKDLREYAAKPIPDGTGVVDFTGPKPRRYVVGE